MKFSILFFATVLLGGVYGDVKAELKLASAQLETGDRAYGQVSTEGVDSYWISVGVTGEKATLLLRKFSVPSFEKQKSVPISYLPIAFAQRSYSAQQKPLIVGLDSQGAWQAIQLDKRLAKVEKTAEIKSIGVAIEVVGIGVDYVIGGSSQRDEPVLVMLDHNLMNQRQVSFSTQKKGEVSSVFINKGKLIAISNYADASAELYELALDGSTRSTIRLKGGAATGIPLKDGGVAITYRLGRQIFVERFDANLRSMWVTTLHAIKNVTLTKNQLLDLQGEVTWIGGNDGRLVVYRIDENGKILQTSLDNEHGFLVPPSGFYSSIAMGRKIHIRGQSRKMTGPVDGSITSFYFIESPRQ